MIFEILPGRDPLLLIRVAVRTRERASLVAEERAFYEVLGHRGQIDRDKRGIGSAGFSVEQTRQQLFSSAALALNKHGGRQSGDLLRKIDDLAHGPAGAENEFSLALFGDLGIERDDLAAEFLALKRIADQRSQSVVVELLRDVVVGALFHRRDGHFYFTDRRDHDDLDETVVLANNAEQV